MIRWDEMRWDEMRWDETNRNKKKQLYRPTDDLFVENDLFPPVLNTEGGEQSDFRPAYNSSSQQNISRQSEIRSTHKSKTSRSSSIPIKKEGAEIFQKYLSTLRCKHAL